MEVVKTDLKSEDEFMYFKNVMMQLYEQNREGTMAFVAQMNLPKQHFLKEIMTVKRVKISVEGVKYDVPRRIIKVKRSGKAAAPGEAEGGQKPDKMVE